jgi:ankyrin repeat protein
MQAMAVHRLIDGIRLQMSTALHGAVEGGHLPTVQLLLAAGPSENKNSTREDDRSPLHRTARLGHGEAVQQLLDRGADDIRGTVDGDMPLLSAAAGFIEQLARVAARFRGREEI